MLTWLLPPGAYGLSTSNVPIGGRFLYVSEEKLSQMWPRVAFVPAARVELVPICVTGCRRSSLRKLSLKKSAFVTSLRNQVFAASVMRPSLSKGFSDGCLLEWQAAQFSAKTSLPRFSTPWSLVRYC